MLDKKKMGVGRLEKNFLYIHLGFKGKKLINRNIFHL